MKLRRTVAIAGHKALKNRAIPHQKSIKNAFVSERDRSVRCSFKRTGDIVAAERNRGVSRP